VAANRVFSGYCRIEAMAGGGQALLLEGLRVHLDLQLEPEATAPMPAGSLDGRRPDVAATERAAPRRARQATQSTPAYQQWAVLAALATLLLALASWWVGGEPAQLVTEPTDAAPSLEDDRGRACFRESLRGSETGDSGSDNDDVYALMHGAS